MHRRSVGKRVRHIRLHDNEKTRDELVANLQRDFMFNTTTTEYLSVQIDQNRSF
jgi:hypothetical protein